MRNPPGVTILRNGATAVMPSTSATNPAAILLANPRNTAAASLSRSTARAGSRLLSRSANERLPERDLAQRRRILARAGQHVIDVGAGDHKPRAEPDQLALQTDIVPNAADAQHLAVRATRVGNALIGLAQTRMVDLAGNPIIGRQVARPDQQHVDARQCRDRRGIFDALGGFPHYD